MNILVVRTDFLGDSVLSSCFIQMLKQLPDAKIDVLCYDYNYAAFQYNPAVENIYNIYKNPNSDKQLTHNSMLLEKLQSQRYNVVFMLNRDFKTYKLLKYVNTPLVFGHRLGVRSLRSKLFCTLTELQSKYNYLPYDDAIHEVINQYNLLNFALPKLKVNSKIHLESNCYFYTANFNPEKLLFRDNHTVVINISGRHETLKYIPSSLVRCIIEELFKLDKKVLIVATNQDLERANRIVDELKDVRLSICTETDLMRVADTMALYPDYIGADGGLLHIAAGLQMRTIGLFNAQNINAWHPWSKRQICLQTASKKIYDLTAVDVLAAYKELLSRNN